MMPSGGVSAAGPCIYDQTQGEEEAYVEGEERVRLEVVERILERLCRGEGEESVARRQSVRARVLAANRLPLPAAVESGKGSYLLPG